MSNPPDRSSVLRLMHDWVESESLRRHMYAVEAAMRAYARRIGADEELYGATGLIHDFDYEKHPDEHPNPGAMVLREHGFPEELVRAVLAHGYPTRTGVRPETVLDRTLRACDEVTGLISAAALVRPSRSLHDLEAKSVMKKFKDRAFAAGAPSGWSLVESRTGSAVATYLFRKTAGGSEPTTVTVTAPVSAAMAISTAEYEGVLAAELADGRLLMAQLGADPDVRQIREFGDLRADVRGVAERRRCGSGSAPPWGWSNSP